MRNSCTEPDKEASGDDWLKFAEQLVVEKKYREAFGAFEKALSLGASDRSRVLTMVGTFHFIYGDPEKAMQELTEALRLNPGNSEALIKKSGLMLESGNYEVSMLLLQEAEQINADDPDLHYHRGQGSS